VCKHKKMKTISCILFLVVQSSLFAQNLKIGDCWLDNTSDIRYCFAADSSTYDKALGDSYRILIVSNTEDDSELAKYYLNVNLSADFDYFFKTDYVDEYGILIIKGTSSFYIYNILTEVLSKQIKPEKRDCEVSDVQGGYIRNLKIIENGSVLQLEIVECGIRRFNIRNTSQIKEI